MTAPKPRGLSDARRRDLGGRAVKRVVNFNARHVRHLKGPKAGEAFVLERWQADQIIRPLFGTLDRDGRRHYREALIGIPRKNGKSLLASGIALYGLFADGWWTPTGDWRPEWGAEVYSVAGSKEQARIVFGAARDIVLGSPLLRASCKVYRDAIEVTERASVYRVLSSDARLAHGYNPSLAIIDELHVHRNGELYEALKTGGGARTQPLVISITTAGWDRKSIAYRLYEAGQAGRDPRMYFRWWEAPQGCRLTDPKALRQANPGRWVTLDFLRSQAAAGGIPEAVFRRLHLNQWTGHAARWIPMDLWDACGDRPKITAGADVWIGVDAAPKRDTTAVVVDHRDDEGIHHVRSFVFEADRTMGYLDFDALEQLLRNLCADYNVRRILVDPYVMTRSMLELAGEGLPVEEFPQNDSMMVPASQALYDLVLEGRLRHGNDRTMRAQADVAAIKETPRGWRLHKLKSSLPIDSVVALAMATHIAEQDAQREAGATINIITV